MTAGGLKERGKYDEMRKTALDTRLAEIAAQIAKEFPDYAELTSPKPLDRRRDRQAPRPRRGAGLLPGGHERDPRLCGDARGVRLEDLPFGADALAEKIAAFRRGLDVDEFQRSLESGKPVLFDVAMAHELYATLFGPVEPLIKDKRHLLVVPSAALTALPFALLVTAPTRRSRGGACRLSRRAVADQAAGRHHAAVGREPEGAARVRAARTRARSRSSASATRCSGRSSLPRPGGAAPS